MTTPKRFYNIANQIIKQAVKSDVAQKHAATILDHGVPIVARHNSSRTTHANKLILSHHAEMAALIGLLRLKGFTELLGLINDTPHSMYFKDKHILKG